MKCINCKGQILDNSIECPLCGFKIKNIADNICKNCNGKLSTKNGVCTLCGYDNSEKNYDIINSKVKNLENSKIVKKIPLITFLFKIFPLFVFLIFLSLIGIIFLTFGCLVKYQEYKQIENYDKINGELYDLSCDSDNVCNGFYKYIVNDVEYSISSPTTTNADNFSKKEIIWYNPNNPSEALIKADLKQIFIFAFIPIFFIVIIVIFVIKKFRKERKNAFCS